MKRNLIVLLVAAFASSLAMTTKNAAPEGRMKELQSAFESRYGELRKLKAGGIVGETFDGFIEFVKEEDEGAAKMVKQENDDRRELYALIAEKEKTTAEVVGQRNARRNFDKAKAGEFLKGKDGKWTQKS